MYTVISVGFWLGSILCRDHVIMVWHGVADRHNVMVVFCSWNRIRLMSPILASTVISGNALFSEWCAHCDQCRHIVRGVGPLEPRIQQEFPPGRVVLLV